MPAGEGQLRGHAFVASTRMLSCWAPMIFVMRSWMRPRPLRADFGRVAQHAAAALAKKLQKTTQLWVLVVVVLVFMEVFMILMMKI